LKFFEVQAPNHHRLNRNAIIWNTSCLGKSTNKQEKKESKRNKCKSNMETKYNEYKQGMKRIVQIATLDGVTFKGEITGSNSRGLFLKLENKTNINDSVFISHQAISHIKVVVEENKTKNT
jgi:hypothetical protein